MLDRSLTPIPGKSLTFNIPEIQRLQLSNGLDINFVHKEKLPIVYAEIIVFSGSRLDPYEKRGLSYLTSLLIDEGAGELNSLQLNDEFQKLGTILSINSNHDTVILSVLSLTEHFNRSLELLSKIILQPRFDERDFNREKKKVLDRILQLKDEPSFIASSVFEKKVFDNTCYAFSEIGYENTVPLITNEDIRNFYKKTITASNAKAIVIGSNKDTDVVELFNGYFNNWNSSSDNEHLFVPPERSNTNCYFVHKSDSNQTEIRIGHIAKKRNADDYYAARIMNTILGGQFSSRINHILREVKGFTYGANSSFHYFRESGLFEVSTAVNIENTGEAIQDILYELNNIRETISPEEIEFAKSYLIKQFPSRFETYIQIAKNFESLIIHSLPEDDLKNYTGSLTDVGIKEVQSAAVNNIHPDELVIIAVGDKEKIYNQLKDAVNSDPIELTIQGANLS
jgi:zinc protease